ncbi:MAG TPA: GDSL-type esterase/lipase family protein [Chitinophagales bacterium]|nr:GDSL-type esterase/lipase family protein [Chitinophagales bacterium]
MKRFTKIAALLYAVIMLLALRELLKGKALFLSTLALYASILYVCLFVAFLLKKAGTRKETIAAFKLVVYSTIISLLVVEFALWFIIKPADCLTYAERGGFNYYSDTMRQKFGKFNRWMIPPYISKWFLINKPNSERLLHKPEFTYLHKFNADGLRTKVIPVTKARGEIRIITLGDSFTEGLGAPQDSTWPALLANTFNSGKRDTTYNIINAGVSSSDPFYETYLLKYRLLKYQPDVVVMCINSSDIDDVLGRGGYERFMPDSTVHVKDSPWWEPIYASSMIYRLVIHRVMHYTYNLVPQAEEARGRENAKIKLKDAVDMFKELAEEYHFKPVIIFHPMLSEIKTGIFPLSPLMVQTEKDSNLTVIDLYNQFETYFKQTGEPPENFYWQNDMHHNSRGYLLWSTIVSHDLKTAGII